MGGVTKNFLLFLFSVVSVIMLRPEHAVAAKTAAQIEKEIKLQEQAYKKIQSQMSMVNRSIQLKQRQERNVAQQIGLLSQKISLTQQRANLVVSKIKKIENNIFVLANNIEKTNKDIYTAQTVLKKRLIDIYKYGGVVEFNLLMLSQKAEDVLANTYLLGKIADQDKRLINDLTEKKRRLTMTQEELKKEQVKLKGQNDDLMQQNRELKSAANERSALLSKVRKDKALFIAQQQELMRASQEMQSAIKKLLAEKREAREKESIRRGTVSKPSTVYYKGGRLMWPVQGTINSLFGTRVHPIFKTKITHTGIDIGAPKGAPVGAAEAGEVLYTGWMRGYGQVVIVDHGGNLTTVYAHLSKIETSENAKVKRGSVIGRVGSTGITTGNHLHFEVRVNGNAVNPMNYLR